MTNPEASDESTRTIIDVPVPFECAYDPDPNNYGLDRDTANRTDLGEGSRERVFSTIKTGTKHLVSLVTIAAADAPMSTGEFIDEMNKRGFGTDGGSLTELWVRGAIERSATRVYGESGASHLWWVNSHGENILAEAVDMLAVEVATDDGGVYGLSVGDTAHLAGEADTRTDGGRPRDATRNALGYLVTPAEGSR